jgi:hypothetical protein
VVTPAAKRKAVAHLVDVYGMSERRACKPIGCRRMTMLQGEPLRPVARLWLGVPGVFCRS